ncbi:MAG TPA: hypothetical protein VI386_29250 [Candidatus Sulfotelmatobacter sp.]
MRILIYRIALVVTFFVFFFFSLVSVGQTNCEEGNGLVDFSAPQTIAVPEILHKLGAAETDTRNARVRYTYLQDARVETLIGNNPDGEFHEVTTVSFDARGKRLENVTYAEQSTLRRAQLTQQDMDDIRIFMPFMLPAEDMPLYNLIYAGQQRVDDLDTYVFHVEPKKEEKDRRYFQGRIWVDNQDFQIVKVCGKSVPETVQVKKHQGQDLRPTFVTYRQQVDGRYWFPAYTRSDDTLHFRNGSIHLREVIKYSNYKRVGGVAAAGEALKP